ncbi:hypothetical protein GQ472_06165 [archaeon]|nr:hypothetical protein [archaeon]
MIEQNLVQLFVGALNKPHQFLFCVNLATTLCHIAKADNPEFGDFEKTLHRLKDNVSTSLPVPLAEADRMFYLTEKGDSEELVSISGTQFEMYVIHKDLDGMLHDVTIMVAKISKTLGLEFNFNINDYPVQ